MASKMPALDQETAGQRLNAPGPDTGSEVPMPEQAYPESKACTKCGEVKPLEEFWRRRAAKDGRASECRSCAGEHKRTWQAQNPQRKREHHQAWLERSAQCRESAPTHKRCRVCGEEKPIDEFRVDKQNLDGRRGECRSCATRAARERPKSEARRATRRAHFAVARAVERGELVRPGSCEGCGKAQDKPLEGHHADYAKPLEVRWLCRSCHRLEHVRLNREAKK